MKNAKTANWTNLVMGVWLFFSPFILESNIILGEVAANRNFHTVGVLVTLTTLMAMYELKPWEEWMNLAFGIWLFISPWALGYSHSSVYYWNALCVGAIIAVASAMALPIAQERSVHVRH